MRGMKDEDASVRKRLSVDSEREMKEEIEMGLLIVRLVDSERVSISPGHPKGLPVVGYKREPLAPRQNRHGGKCILVASEVYFFLTIWRC